jgi:hypothetical protein
MLPIRPMTEYGSGFFCRVNIKSSVTGRLSFVCTDFFVTEMGNGGNGDSGKSVEIQTEKQSFFCRSGSGGSGGQLVVSWWSVGGQVVVRSWTGGGRTALT